MLKVAVFGATGKQGSSVVRALSQNGEFHVIILVSIKDVKREDFLKNKVIKF